MAERDRKAFWGRLAEDVRSSMAAPDFWPMLGLFSVFVAAFGAFFWFAVGFDELTSIAGRWGGACRKLGGFEATVLFVSPFAIALSSLVAAGEFVSQLERRQRWGKPMRWEKILGSFGLALGMLLGSLALMMAWC